MQDNAPNAPRPRRITITSQPFAGFAAESAADGEPVRVLFQCGITADDPRFYLFVNQLSDDFLARAGINGDSITKFFVVQRPDGTADVYTDYGVIVQAQVNRDVKKGEPIYEHDISAIKGYRPEGVTLQPTDTVICVMKVGWKYGLFFDASWKITEDNIWRELGELYQGLQVDRVLANIQERVKLAQRPHVITEGKTDWRHIEAARRALGVDIPVGYPTTDDSLGDTALLQVCERLGKFGPPNANKVIAVFDRDNRQVLSKLQARGDLDSFQRWGNNVYSLVLPKPPHRANYNNISVELLYTETDLRTANASGKRLHFDNELKTEVLPDGQVRYVPVAPAQSKELDKRPFDGKAELIVDDSGQQVGLSKARFAKLVYDSTGPLGSLDMSGFAPVFQIIKDIMLDRGDG